MKVKINVINVCIRYEHPTLLNLSDFNLVYGTGTYYEYMYEETENHSKSVCMCEQTTFTIVDDRVNNVLSVTVYNSTHKGAKEIGDLVKREIEHYEEIEVDLRVLA